MLKTNCSQCHNLFLFSNLFLKHILKHSALQLELTSQLCGVQHHSIMSLVGVMSFLNLFR